MLIKKKEKFPYQNLSLINLPKEKWKEIPGFEGYYEISDYGRVRTIPRETSMNTPQGGIYISRERILKAHLLIKENKVIGEPIYTLIISLSKEGIAHHFSIARMVYFLFKEKFDLENKYIFISPKDHDGRNVHVSNLVKSNMRAVKLASYREGRAISHLKKLSKPVTQFDQKGNPIRNFPSMYEAGKLLGIGERNIAEVVNGPGNMYKGFFWKEGVHKRKLDLSKLTLGKSREEINLDLKKRLGIKKIDKKNIPAILNLSLTSMKGERWKSMPGYDDLYMVSNFGRVKALQKITFGLKKMWMPEQIKKLTIDFRKDEKGKEIAGSALVGVAKKGKKKIVSVPRLVYYLFVRKIKLSDTDIRVYYKDGNTLNLYYKNLILKRGVWSFKKIKKIL